MQFLIQFNHSNDKIVFESVQDDVVRHFVTQVNEVGCNNFIVLNNFVDRTKSIINTLKSIIDDIAQWPVEIRPPFIESYTELNLLDQSVLNQLHADWANGFSINWDVKYNHNRYQTELTTWIFDQFPDEIPYPPFSVVLEKLNLLTRYRELNPVIHALEGTFELMKFEGRTTGWTDKEWIELSNPFGTSIVSNTNTNFTIEFNHLGRTLYNKWLHFDTKLECNDENTFRFIVPSVSISLSPPRTNGYCQEFLTWCETLNQIPSGSNICLGNIVDLNQNLCYYRSLILENAKQNNVFSITY